MSIKDLAVVQAYHLDRVGRFGIEASEALGWKNQASQQRRFQQLSRLGDFAGKSVLDLGCGHGDLYRYLKATHGDFRYTGIEYVRIFLNVAVKEFVDDPNARFLVGEFGSVVLPPADYVICCGALNYRNSEPGYLERMITRFFDACTIGLGLNLLWKVDFPDGVLVPYDPDEVADFCHQLTPDVRLELEPADDYFTVFLYQDGRDPHQG